MKNKKKQSVCCLSHPGFCKETSARKKDHATSAGFRWSQIDLEQKRISQFQLIVDKFLNIMFHTGLDPLQTGRLIFSLSAAHLSPASLSCLSFPPDACTQTHGSQIVFLVKTIFTDAHFLFFSSRKKGRLHRNMKGVRNDANGVKLSA